MTSNLFRVVAFGIFTAAALPSGAFAQGASAATASQQPAALAAYVGTYRDAARPEAVIAVYVKNGVLTYDSERELPNALTSAGQDTFAIADTPLQMHFTRDGAGKVTGATMRQGVGSEARAVASLTRISDASTPLNHGRTYVRSEAMVPMRDGVKLHVVILRPEGSEKGEPLPVLLTRTPYGVDEANNRSVNGSKPELAASGYIFVYGDIRGRYKSEGRFVMNRPVVHRMGDHTDAKLIDESTDCYDTVAWLVKNLPNNNGRVGVLGVSYPGFLAMMAGVDHHPAVKAISPQAPMTDVWLGDDFFHNGAFRQTYGFDYVQELEKGKTDDVVSSTADTFDFFLKNRNFEGAAAAAKMTELPTAQHFLKEPSYTASWRAMAVQNRLGRPEVPTLEVGGFYDQEDMWGTQAEYAALRSHEEAGGAKVYLVLGPWNHGGWGGSGARLDHVSFGEPTGDEYRKQVEAPFFEQHLKDRPGFDLEDTASFRTGVNRWQRYAAWPPKEGFHKAELYLHTGGDAASLRFERPKSAAEPLSYTSDPTDPVPYRPRPIQSTYGQGSKWRTWLANDQSFLRDRRDIARFNSPALEHDVTVTGDIVADLYAATTGTDADWVVKLMDVYPDDAPDGMAGYRLMIAEEIFRGRYRKSFEQPAPIAANQVEEYRWSLHGADHTFLKGHRMMVEVQSTWFPLYDRNPQTYVSNIMTAPAAAYQKQTIRIYGDAAHPSHLEVLRPDSEELVEAEARR